MISERQAETLLQECEKGIGRSLYKLRERIANQEKTLSNLWELIVLHAALPLGSIEHEHEEASRPDVRVGVARNQAFWIEAAYIYSRAKPCTDDASDFVDWMLRELEKQGVKGARQANLELLLADALRPFEVPKQNDRPQLLRSSSWRRFCESARESHCTACRWICPSGNLAVELRGLSQSRTRLWTLPPFEESRSPTDHPVYKAIAGKAKQAERWHVSGRSYQPLVLCIGAERAWEVNNSGSGGTPLRRAVYSAFLNVRGMSLTEQVNITGRIDGRHYQVRGSKYVSAVVVVTVEPGSKPFTVSGRGQRVRLIPFTNPQAATLLTQAQFRLLEQLDFNSIEWGPGWEAWQAPRGTKRAENTTISRIRRQGGSISMRSVSGGSFGIEIPVHIIARLLAGDMAHKDVETAFHKHFVGRLKRALEQGERIVGCEYIPADGKSRDHDRILFRYGPPKLPVISDPDKRGGTATNKNAGLGRAVLRRLSALLGYLRGRSRG